MKEDIALKKVERLRKLVQRLKLCSPEDFMRVGLRELVDKLSADPLLLSSLSGILPTIPAKLKGNIEVERRRAGGIEDAWLLGVVGQMQKISERAALRLYALREMLSPTTGTPSCFTIRSWSSELSPEGEHKTQKDRIAQFFSSCVDPLLDYIEESVDGEGQLFIAFERYKVLCEWYDKEALRKSEETEMTREHLTKFLFDEGYTYNLTEVVSPSGRIDNLVPSDAVIAEAKIFDGQASVKKVCNQIEKRLQDFNLPTGYCVVYCKDKQKGVPNFLDADGSEGPFVILRSENGKRIAIMVVRLFDIPSTETVKNIDVRLK